MVAEHGSITVREEKDSNILCCSDSSEFHVEHTYKSIFDVVRNGEVCDIESLVEKLGSECLSSRDEWGYTPAHWAALDGNVEVIRYLVERSAPVDLSCLGTQGPRPIHWACRKGHTSIVQILLQVSSKKLFQSFKCHADLIRLLMYSGIDLQKPDNFGSTPLHLACLSGNVNCVKLLCQKSKIELEPQDKNGKTPLLLAKSHRHSEVVQVLMTEQKRRARWMPPISEIWALLFGGAGDSKGPLLLFMGSVLLWGYPMYLLRCVPITWNALRGSHYIFIYWNCVMWLSWVIANRRNPGYLPLNSDGYRRAVRNIPCLDNKWQRRRSGLILARLCHSCRCLRPLRAKHCRICNRCVEYFDHHCPFIYNCVGLKNRMWFFLFVTSIAINCSFTIYFACYCIAVEGFHLLYGLGLVEALVFCFLGWILTCTSVLHACMNLTTNEMLNYKRYSYLRDKRGRYFNPFSRGPLLNLLEFFVCSPDYASDLELQEEDVI
uniref:Palmitoyltransferase n=2 Tax=Timema TaxID=61471 RepID=A0A7R9E1C9_9NEOP|nr:unnamed protein product [Timema cristinae]CAD7424475.1 unnamed protein product [Timema monikensis]